MLEINNRTVVITGGATGIGFGLAKACGAMGARIVIGEPRQARLDEAVSTLTEAGIVASACAVDVADSAQLARFVDHAFDAFGEVALVINTGIGQPLGSVLDTPVGRCRRSWRSILRRSGEAASSLVSACLSRHAGGPLQHRV